MEFTEMYNNYYPRLVRWAQKYLSREDAENLSQDVFLYVWENWATLKDDMENVTAFLFGILRNKSISLLRGRLAAQRYAEYAKDVYNFELRMQVQSLNRLNSIRLSAEDLNMIVRSAVASLPTQCRRVFILSRVNKLTYKEIACKLNLSEHTVSSQMTTALRKLREKLMVSLAA